MIKVIAASGRERLIHAEIPVAFLRPGLARQTANGQQDILKTSHRLIYRICCGHYGVAVSAQCNRKETDRRYLLQHLEEGSLKAMARTLGKEKEIEVHLTYSVSHNSSSDNALQINKQEA
jgi:hypothetical protein